MWLRLLTGTLLALAVARPAAAQGPAEPDDGVAAFVARLEQAVRSGNPSAYLELLSAVADRTRAAAFAEAQIPRAITRAVVRQRDRASLAGALPGEGYRLVMEAFLEVGARGRIATWRLDVRRARQPGVAAGGPSDEPWLIADQEQLTAIEGLHRLALNPRKQYDARDLVVTAEDLELRLARGSVFVAEISDGVTALVLMGQGAMVFTPGPAAERGQVKIFSGSETLRTSFSRAFLRINPQEFERRFTTKALAERPVDEGELRRAREVFDTFLAKSFSLDLSDLSRDTWSLAPGAGDFLAEIVTRRDRTLTYAHSGGEAEDITLFDRERKRNIALYASERKLASRGRYYDDSALVDYDILDYNLDVAFDPPREWLEGRARLRIRVRAYLLATLTMRLAEPLAIASITSDELGRLLFLRVRGQDNVIVNLPAAVPRDVELTLNFTYSGRLAPQPVDREAAAPGPQESQWTSEAPVVAPEPRYLYSNRAHWYPQSTVSDYATATLRVTVPAEYTCVASGEAAQGSPVMLPAEQGPGRKMFVFLTLQPARYLSFVISRFSRVAATSVSLDPSSLPTVAGDDGAAPNERVAGILYDEVALAVEANPRQQGRGGTLAERAADVIRFYTAVVGDYPYPSFTLALTDSDLPGGHSPAYFAVLNQPLPTSQIVWRNDPVSFEGYPSFFLAHELAHQWWGQAVGWKNYHEQWLSEGFAQYFAALYAQHDRGDELFTDMLRQMRRWAMEHTDEGPVYLGYRLGHIRNQGRVFRALVYNKAALVLHMLRRLVGDEAFFRGIRRFYAESRFQKAGTEDLRRAVEAETELSLERFFERWIHESALPRLRFRYFVESAPADVRAAERGAEARPTELVLRFEQEGNVFDLPVTVTISYASGETRHVVVPVTNRISELRVPLAGELRSVDVNRDHAALAHIRK